MHAFPPVPARAVQRLGLVALIWVAVGACASHPPDIPVAVEVPGRAVDVTCSVDCGGAAEEAARFVDMAAEIAGELLGVEPDSLGRLHLARDVAEYESLEEHATGGRFRSNLAFSKPEWHLSVVAIQPSLADRVLAETSLPMQTLRLAAHEAAHLASYAAMPPPRRVPGWLEEGLAVHVETETRSRLGRIAENVGEDPLFSTYYVRVGEAEADGRLPALSDLLADRSGDLTSAELYAVRVVLFRSLVAESGAAVRAGLRAAVEVHRARGQEAEVKDAFVDAFGGADRIERAFETHRAEAHPAWRELNRTLETSGDVWLQHPFPNGAHSVRLDPAGERWTLSTDVRFGGDDPVAAITLRTDDGLWGFVRITAEDVALVRDEPREMIGRTATAAAGAAGRGGASDAGDIGGVAPSRARPGPAAPVVRVEIEVQGSAITVRSSLGDLETVVLPVRLSGPWGLLARPGGWVAWGRVAWGS